MSAIRAGASNARSSVRRLHLQALLLASTVALAAVTAVPVSAGATSTPNAVEFGGTAAVGALFTTTANGKLASHFCTGSVVDSPAGDLVVTAAHCVTGRSAKEMVFVPGYANGKTPYGIWSVSQVIVDNAWASTEDPNDDVAFLIVHEPKNTSSIQSMTGGEQLATGESCGQTVEVIGYPDTKTAPVSCENVVLSFGSTQLEFKCGGYTTGTSGGPMLANVSEQTGIGTVIGVIGGYEQGGDTPSVSYAAKFKANVQALYEVAIT
jgi:V8-like Glu-specific endopeptidase